MLFNIAQSAAPTRAPSPDTQEGTAQLNQGGQTSTRPILSNARRIEYLKNYVGQVAPWVSYTCDVARKYLLIDSRP